MGPPGRTRARRRAERARRGRAPRRRDMAQRWSEQPNRAIRDSRVVGTRELGAGQRARRVTAVRALISGSAISYYGARGEEPLDEGARPRKGDFLAECARNGRPRASGRPILGCASCRSRTGVVLDAGAERSPRCCRRFSPGRRWPGGRRAPVRLLDPR